MYDRVGVALLPIIKELTSRVATLEEENAHLKKVICAVSEKLGI